MTTEFMCICDQAAHRPKSAQDLVVLLVRAIVSSQTARSSLLSKGHTDAKTILRVFFESAHAYVAQHVKHKHSTRKQCSCLDCLGCACATCQTAPSSPSSHDSPSDADEVCSPAIVAARVQFSVRMQNSESDEDKEQSESSQSESDDERTECELCGKKIKDMVVHMARLHPGAVNAIDAEADADADAHERKRLQEQLEAAEKAEQEAKELAARALEDKTRAEAKANALVKKVAQQQQQDRAQPMEEQQQHAAAAPPQSQPQPQAQPQQPRALPPPAPADAHAPALVLAPSPAASAFVPFVPHTTTVKAAAAAAASQTWRKRKTKRAGVASVVAPLDLSNADEEMPPVEPWDSHSHALVVANPPTSHPDPREQVQQMGAAIKHNVVHFAVSSLWDPLSERKQSTASLETTLSFVPGRPSDPLPPKQATVLYKTQTQFRRTVDLRTRFACGRLARQFYTHDGGGTTLAQSAAAREAVAGHAVNFASFCPAILGATSQTVRAEILFSLLCDMVPGFLPALLQQPKLFRWTDFSVKTTIYYDEWKQWFVENGLISPRTELPLLTVPVPPLLPSVGEDAGSSSGSAAGLAAVHALLTLGTATHAQPHKRKAEADFPAPAESSGETASPAAKKPRIETEAKSDSKSPEHVSAANTQQQPSPFQPAAPVSLVSVATLANLTTTHIQTIRRYDPPLIHISSVVDTASFRAKQLQPVRFSESGLVTAIQTDTPYLATDVPVSYRGNEVLPSSDQLLAELQAALGRTLEKVDVHEGEARSESLYVKSVFDTWTESGARYLPPDQLGNIINGRADAFVKRFAFGGGLDSGNALRLSPEKKDLRAVTLSPRGAWTNTHYDDYTAVTLYLTGLKFWMFMCAEEARQFPGIRDTSTPSTAGASNTPAAAKPADPALSFSLHEFCQMRRSWWALAGAGQLIAAPEGMLHRVVTLEPTFGVTFNFEPKRTV